MPILACTPSNPVARQILAFAFVASLCLSLNAGAQQMLVFNKGKNKMAHYQAGELISFRIRGDKERYTAQIEGFTDTTIVFRHAEVALREISHIYVDQKTREWFAMRYKYEKLLLIAGFGYLMLDVIHTGELTQETKWVSLSLISAGVLAKFLISDRFRIRGNKRLSIVDI
jgi:hypothetical protein